MMEPVLSFVLVGVVLAILLIHVAFAIQVGFSAAWLPSGNRPVFVSPFLWFLSVLLFGPFLAVGFWLIHHSTLNPKIQQNKKE